MELNLSLYLKEFQTCSQLNKNVKPTVIIICVRQLVD